MATVMEKGPNRVPWLLAVRLVTRVRERRRKKTNANFDKTTQQSSAEPPYQIAAPFITKGSRHLRGHKTPLFKPNGCSRTCSALRARLLIEFGFISPSFASSVAERFCHPTCARFPEMFWNTIANIAGNCGFARISRAGTAGILRTAILLNSPSTGDAIAEKKNAILSKTWCSASCC